ncbi:MAG: alanine--glyoxylate aminotransferase family protein [Kiritimatiellaeota bacterium]|nr:alanine--glyoxylate aminotransferase family protein [Kiritimatiellota bacterium]
MKTKNLKLMIPGPTEVSRTAREQLALPIRPHYGPEWVKLFFDVVGKLKKVFQTTNDLYVFAATSSATMEVGISHAAEPGEKILICNNGVFGDRFTEMAKINGLCVVTTRSDYGQPITVEQVRKALNADKDIRAVAIVHNESSTAVESALSGITTLARERGVLTVVDCVSSMAGVDVPTDKLGIDFCLSGSQKCFQAPAGLGFISVSSRAWERIRARREPVRSWYLSLDVMHRYRDMWMDWHPQGPNTASVPLYQSLNQALDEILAEGLPARFARHVRARDAFRAAMRAMGLQLFAADAVASKTLTAVCLPAGIDGVKLRNAILVRHDILLAGGLGPTANTVIRVGHLGHTAAMDYLVPTIQAIEHELIAMGAVVTQGVAAKVFEKEFE